MTGKADVDLKLKNRLTLQLALLVLVTCLIMGMAGYVVARRELGIKGETILKNGVKMALDIIEANQQRVLDGAVTTAEAQERVKTTLLGPMNPDGTRELHGQVDLGRNGYFIVYGSDGMELMHPLLEGKNMWSAVDPMNKKYYLVQDQIAKARNGGGFTWYNWDLPKSQGIGRKLTYSEYEPKWGWVVCASAYLVDFDQGANTILGFTLLLALVTLALGVFLARHFLQGVTAPVERLLSAMRRAERLQEGPADKKREDEIGGLVEGYNALMDNITEAQRKIREKEQAIYRLAYHDQLCDLPNRNLFKKRVDEDIAKSVDSGILYLMDIRNFRLINTLQGEETGDEVLRLIGVILNRFQGDFSAVGRISGDEFGAWVVNKQEADFMRSIEALRSLFANVLLDKGISLRVDVRIGYAVFPQDGKDFEHCYKSASIAMKRAKDLGGNAIVKYDESLHASIARLELLKQSVEKAIDDRSFYMVYQEKVDPTGQHPRSVEALARWISPEEGQVSPNVFIPIVEEHGLITRFGEMILELVMADYGKLEDKYGAGVTVSINVSPMHLFDINFSTKLFNEIKKHRIDPSHIMLEITESIQIDDFERMKTLMSKIGEFGVKFSLDDFGTGYSSLSYIFRLPIDELKIDKAFIDSLDTDPNAVVMLGAICRLAKAYGLTIVAEGVETKQQEACLISEGVDLIQGYLYARPEPL